MLPLIAALFAIGLLACEQEKIPEEQPDTIFIVGDVSKLRITGLPNDRRQIIHLARDGDTVFRMGYSAGQWSSVDCQQDYPFPVVQTVSELPHKKGFPTAPTRAGQFLPLIFGLACPAVGKSVIGSSSVTAVRSSAPK